MIQQTSMEAFKSILPELSEKQGAVFEVILKNSNMSNHDIARFLGWEINSVTPRVKELRDLGYVFYTGKKKDRITGRTVMVWSVL